MRSFNKKVNIRDQLFQDSGRKIDRSKTEYMFWKWNDTGEDIYTEPINTVKRTELDKPTFLKNILG